MLRGLLLFVFTLATACCVLGQTSHFTRWKAGLKRVTNYEELLKLCAANGFILRESPPSEEFFSNGPSFGRTAFYRKYKLWATLYEGEADTSNNVPIRPNSEIDADEPSINVLLIGDHVVCMSLYYKIRSIKQDTTIEIEQFIWPSNKGLDTYNKAFGATLARKDIERALEHTSPRFGIIASDFNESKKFDEYLLLEKAILTNDFRIISNLLASPNWGIRTFGIVGVEYFRTRGLSIPISTESIIKEYWSLNPVFEFQTGCVIVGGYRWADSGDLFMSMLKCLPH